MLKTILLDLDDTLLDNKMERFLPAYFQRLGQYMSDTLSPESSFANSSSAARR
jgi:FMN phosphatase YigB (HAD superfamily)